MMIKKRMGLVLVLALALPSAAHAAHKRYSHVAASSEEDYSSSSSSHSSGHSDLSADVTLNYLRGTQPDQATDSAPRVSVGGMFSDWIGLDFQGLYSMRSKNFLIGSDLRLMATDWLYIKGGIGGYSDKTTRQFTMTPLAGSGIRIKLSSQTYLLTEANYFQVNRKEYLGIGAGLGMVF